MWSCGLKEMRAGAGGRVLLAEALRSCCVSGQWRWAELSRQEPLAVGQGTRVLFCRPSFLKTGWQTALEERTRSASGGRLPARSPSVPGAYQALALCCLGRGIHDGSGRKDKSSRPAGLVIF